MKNCLLILSLVIIGSLAISCNKNKGGCTPVTVQGDEPAILAYAAANGITPVKHTSGLYYEIINPGSGVTPGPTSKVSVKYTGKLINNSIFDQLQQPNNPGWALNTLIAGWQIGIPLIQKGGKIKLLVPSALAYGCQSLGAVPSNAILIFDIDLVDVQ